MIKTCKGAALGINLPNSPAFKRGPLVSMNKVCRGRLYIDFVPSLKDYRNSICTIFETRAPFIVAIS